jgi:hypothetical protein
MSTKYGILSVGVIGCLGFVAGLIYYLTASRLHTALGAGAQTHETVFRIMFLGAKVLLFGGLAVMIVSLFCYMLYRKWEKKNHDT